MRYTEKLRILIADRNATTGGEGNEIVINNMEQQKYKNQDGVNATKCAI